MTDEQLENLRDTLRYEPNLLVNGVDSVMVGRHDLTALIDAYDEQLNRTDSYPCRRCGFRSGLDAMVSDDVWAMIGGKTFDKLCLWCIDDLCNEAGIKSETVVLYFGGGKSLHTTTDILAENVARFDALASCANALQQKVLTLQLELDAVRQIAAKQEPPNAQ